jgi:hypothetical protein
VNCTWAGKTCSRLLVLVAALVRADVIVTTPDAGEFRFHDLEIWRYSEARGERIPALSADLDNLTGKDWAEAMFRVIADCESESRSYTVRLANLAPGHQRVAETAFDAIGVVAPCDARDVRIEFVGGKPPAIEDTPTYVVLGFALETSPDHWTTELDGILDYRRPTQFRSSTRPACWQDGGQRLFERDGPEPVAFYSIRVDPGELGLAGFTLTCDPNDPGLLARFLRYYLVPPGKAAYLGVFRVFHGAGNEVGVRMEFDETAFEELSKRPEGVSSREVVAVHGALPLVPRSTILVK